MKIFKRFVRVRNFLDLRRNKLYFSVFKTSTIYPSSVKVFIDHFRIVKKRSFE